MVWISHIKRHYAPSIIASQLQLLFQAQAFGGEKGHVSCCPWSEGLSVMAGEPCMKLFLVSLLSFSWLFHSFDRFEGLEILFFLN